MTQNWPDIQFVVKLIAQFGGNPGVAHLEATKYILHYLKGTTDFGLVLGRQTKESFDLVGWTDSNWAQDPDDCHSVGGSLEAAIRPTAALAVARSFGRSTDIANWNRQCTQWKTRSRSWTKTEDRRVLLLNRIPSTVFYKIGTLRKT